MRLLRPIGPELNGAVYIVDGSKRYYVRDGGVARAHNLDIGNITDVPNDELYSYHRGQWAPNIWPDHIVGRPPLDLSSQDMREIIAQDLRGSGVEIGAYTAPFPLPLRCDTTYADHWPYEQLIAAADPSVDKHEIVRPSIVAHFEDLSAIKNESCDYFVASHVIEHTRSPIKCIHDALEKLRPGGSLVLVVPDKHKTFDRERGITSLEHLIYDHIDYREERDIEHYLEFFNKAHSLSGVALVEAARDAMAKRDNIHFHTWDYESFSAMIDYIVESRRSGPKPVVSVLSHPTRNGDASFEFYFKLTV